VKTITGIIIAKNGEKLIGEALQSIKFCDELIVINNNSLDKTGEVAVSFNAKVYDINSGDFSELRNYGLSKSNSDYVLYIDTDERVDDLLKENIKKILSDEIKYSAFKLKRKNFYFGNHEWPQIEKLERLFVKKNLEGWYGKLHESPKFTGEAGDMEGFLLHFTHRDLESMLSKTIDWSDKEALLRFNSGHPKMIWWRFPRVMITAFLSSFIKQKGFKAGTAGVVESIYQAFSMFVTYAKLWELQAQFKNQPFDKSRTKVKNI
jgi:glycosyltransferase involved in cell wall biosynthesis